MSWLTEALRGPQPAGSESPKQSRPKIGEFDHLEATIGARGEGKSTWQCFRALELSRQSGGAYVIGHSLGARLPKKLPDELGGETLPIQYHATIKSLESGLRRKPDRWHILAPPLSQKDRETADDLLQFLVRFSDALRRSAWKKAHPLRLFPPKIQDYDGVECVPIVCLVDEGVAVESAGPSRKEGNRWFLELLFSLRHYHTALLWSVQDPSARSWRILEQSTEIYVFRVRHAWALQTLLAAGANSDEIDEIKRFKKKSHDMLQVKFEAPADEDIPQWARDTNP